MSHFLATLFLAALTSGPALAAPVRGNGAANAPKAEATDRVTIEVQVVHASDSFDTIDPALTSLASSLRYLKFKGYKLLSAPSAALKAGQESSFPLEGNRTITVKLVDRDDARARVRVTIARGDEKLLDSTVSINRDGTFIVAGPKFKDGILVLPLRARF